ncbi:MAG TPA: NAD(P)-binding domain-containing protein [Anaerolineales bacterium]|jgi:hypothetical protein
MNIGILGTGVVGKTIGTRLVELGHNVRMGSRTADNLNAQAWVRSVGESASHGTYSEAARYSNILFNCTAGRGTLSALELIKAADLNNKILIDVANPLDYSRGMPPTMSVCNTDSLGEQIQREHKLLRVVKAVNCMGVEVMVNPKLVPAPRDALICGNDLDAKNNVTAILIEWFGWDSVIDLGDISNARGMEMALPLWLSLRQKFGTNNFHLHVAH